MPEPKRRRRWLGWCARLVIIAYIFQIGAFDHLSSRGASLADAQFHRSHCHGGASGCAGETSLTGSLAEVSLMPAPPSSVFFPEIPAVMAPLSQQPTPAEKPPRAALA